MNDKVWFPTSTSSILFLFPVAVPPPPIPGWPKLRPVLHGMSPTLPCLARGSCPYLPCLRFPKEKNPHLSQEGLWSRAGSQQGENSPCFPYGRAVFFNKFSQKPKEPQMRQGLKMTQLKEYNWIWRGEACFKRKFLGCLFLKG